MKFGTGGLISRLFADLVDLRIDFRELLLWCFKSRMTTLDYLFCPSVDGDLILCVISGVLDLSADF